MPSLKCNKERQGNSLKNPGVTFVQKPQVIYNYFHKKALQKNLYISGLWVAKQDFIFYRVEPGGIKHFSEMLLYKINYII